MYETIKKLINKNLSIVTAESITGGFIAKTITDVPGASSIFKKGFIVYSDEAKIEILGVNKDTIKTYGVVSKEVACEMADRLYKMTMCDLCISTTGNAGPTVCDDKPVGRVYIGIAYKSKVSTYEYNFSINGTELEVRDYIRRETNKKVFEEIKKML